MYSFIPISFPGSYPAVAFWGASFSIYLLIEIVFLIINILVYFFTLFVVTRLIGNSSSLSKKQLFIVSVLISITLAVFYSIITFILPSYAKLDPKSFLSNLTPGTYEFLTVLLFPGIVNFIFLLIFLRRYTLKKLMLTCIVVATLNLPWWIYFVKSGQPNPEKVGTITRSQQAGIADQIKVAAINEELVPDPVLPKYKQLRITAKVIVSKKSKYALNWILTRANKYSDTPEHKYTESPYVSFINDKPVSTYGGLEMELEAGENILKIDFPYIWKRYDSEELNLASVDNNPTGTYGPYVFVLSIQGYYEGEKFISLGNSLPKSDMYKTKGYSYTRFYQ